jgi:hypothetical protein
MKTYNRAKLLRQIQKGLVTVVKSYDFNDQPGYGATRTDAQQEGAARLMPEDRSKVTEGTYYLYETDFTHKGPRATDIGTDAQGRQLVHLRIHSNSNFTFAINARPVKSTQDHRESFARTHPRFQQALADIAGLTRTNIMQVYALWTRYTNSDQSAILAEFVDWYYPQLDPQGHTSKAEIHRLAVDPFHGRQTPEPTNVLQFTLQS